MDYDSLKIFLHLAETLHFGKTSRACFISTSGLSRIIQRLEKEAGKELFIRDNRSVSITPAGLLLKEYARDVLERWRIFREQANDDNVIYGELRIYCSVTASYGILKEALGNYRMLYPNVHINLQTGEEAKALQMVQDRSADMSIAARPDKLPDNIEFFSAAVTPLLFIAPVLDCHISGELKKNTGKWKDLPLILPEHGLARNRVEELFRKNRARMNIYADVSGNEAIIAMVSLGCGIGIVPGLVLEQSPLKNEVRVIELKHDIKPYNVGFCLYKGRNLPLPVQAFRNIIKEKEL